MRRQQSTSDAVHRAEPRPGEHADADRAALLESISDTAIGIDHRGALTWFNPAAADLLHLTMQSIGHDAEQLVADASGMSTGRALEARLIQIGGRLLMVSSDREALRSAQRSRLVIFRDYSRDAAMLRDLDGAQEHIEALRAHGHEFANTLHIVKGLLEMGESQRALDFVRSGGLSGDLALAVDEIADPSIRALIRAYRARARERGIDLTPAATSAFPDLAGADPGFLEASLLIVGNFLSNAVESCAHGDRIDIAITTAESALTTGLLVHIRVDDSGPGVASDLRERLFALGTTTKTGSTARGCGLGIVHGTVTRLGGTCTFERSGLGGTRFEASLPVPESERWRFTDG
ncbi:sensor histidine kinase [Microbacterium saperdae]|uniref:histidine kinase n=1 Tax=Microbacterium saperdae TaxID=69368 RepID=A0A543BAM2_9MICO|nr:ATP-binding protein [Microbacterium saperdae]TQL81793.1 sensor kinase SpoOB-type protein [Microbacterium saperdae]GGM34850.1 hypothetical protein GCM10010489_02040 [Microbacterium saperdae]